jgi:two-component system cell cycle response regulator
MNYERAIEVAEGIFWVGFYDREAGFHCNPYLLIDNEEAVLFDPGTKPHLKEIVQKVIEIINPGKITYIVLHHQDPDLCAAVPEIEKFCSPELKIVTSWRAGVLIAYYGIEAPFYYVDRNNYSLQLKSGRILQFIPTPFCHSPGSIVTFDKKTGALFSSDLFGAFSYDWSLFANPYYMEAMKAFHEPYMASKDILRKNMERIERFPVRLILPQHGSILKDKQVKEAIEILKNLDCGIDFIPYEEVH